MRKFALEDVTFLFPVRLDSLIRLENLLLVTEHLLKHFSTNIYVLEADRHDNGLLGRLLAPSVKHFFVEDYDPVFYRTHYINALTKKCATPFVAVWDSDVIVDPSQIIEAVRYLRDQSAEFVRPYNDLFLDTTMIIRSLYVKTRDLDRLHRQHGKMTPLYAPNPVGGGFFATLEKYIESGSENENFYGWGIEDGERVNRWKVLGYSYRNTSGVMYHLSHPRGVNSQFHSLDQMDIKNAELYRIVSMSQEELKQEIATWKT